MNTNNNITEFHKISLMDMEWYKQKEAEDYVEDCDSVFANNYLWGETYGTDVALINNCLVIRYQLDFPSYTFPMGGSAKDKKAAIETLLSKNKKDDEPFKIILSSASKVEQLESMFPGQFKIDQYRDGFDYVYSTEVLSQLRGKKYSAKRNHINRFKDQGEWSYEKINEDNKAECIALEKNWLKQKKKNSDSEESINEAIEERSVLLNALEQYDTLKLRGGVIRLNGKVVAFAIGEELNKDTMVVHFEKAIADVQGAYQIINQQFALNECADYKYINREDDMGEPGLRKAKLSYTPDHFVEKYIAEFSNINYATKKDEEQIVNLWHQAFGDSKEYINFYMKNKFEQTKMLCYRIDKKIVSMITLMPIEVEGEEGYYVYAVATDKEHKKKGYATKLLKTAMNDVGGNLYLKTENEELISYYNNIGFTSVKDGAKLNVADFADETDEDIVIASEYSDEIAREYGWYREKALEGINHIKWDYDAVEYALKELYRENGFMARVDDDYVLYYIEESTLVVEECLKYIAANKVTELIALAKYLNCSNIVYENNHIMTSGNNTETYLGLTLG